MGLLKAHSSLYNEALQQTSNNVSIMFYAGRQHSLQASITRKGLGYYTKDYGTRIGQRQPGT